MCMNETVRYVWMNGWWISKYKWGEGGGYLISMTAVVAVVAQCTAQPTLSTFFRFVFFVIYKCFYTLTILMFRCNIPKFQHIVRINIIQHRTDKIMNSLNRAIDDTPHVVCENKRKMIKSREEQYICAFHGRSKDFYFHLFFGWTKCPILSFCVPSKWTLDHRLSIRVFLILLHDFDDEQFLPCSSFMRWEVGVAASSAFRAHCTHTHTHHNAFQTNDSTHAVDVFSISRRRLTSTQYSHESECLLSALRIIHFGGRGACNISMNLTITLFDPGGAFAHETYTHTHTHFVRRPLLALIYSWMLCIDKNNE